MHYLAATRRYLRMFYFLGLSPYHPNGRYVPSLICKFSHAMMILQALVTFAIAIPGAIHLHSVGTGAEYTLSDIAMVDVFLFCECVRSICILVQSFGKRKVIHSINVSFQQVEWSFVTRLHHRIPYRKLKNRLRCTAILLLYGYLQIFITYVMRNLVSPRLARLNGQIKILQALSMVMLLHIIFYVEVLSFFMDNLLAVLERDSVGKLHGGNMRNIILVNAKQRNWSNACLREKILLFKSIHFKLWKVSEQISRYFGWCLMILLAQSCILMIYALHWFMIHINKAGWGIKAARKTELNCTRFTKTIWTFSILSQMLSAIFSKLACIY